MTYLEPCPFCGMALVEEHGGWFDHPKGKCILSGSAFHKGFIGQWNTRATPPEVTALVEALHGLVDDDNYTGYCSCDECHDKRERARAALAKW